MDWKVKYAREDIADYKRRLKIIPIVNFIFFLFFLSFSFTINYNRITLLIATSLTFFLIRFAYNWSSTMFNFILLSAYTETVILEIIVIGIPESGASFGLGKGILLDIFIFACPIIYIGVRLAMGLPILLLESKKLKLKKLLRNG